MGQKAPWGAKGRPFPTEKGFRHTNSQVCRSEKHISFHQYQSSSCNGLTGSCNTLAGKEARQARTQRSALCLEAAHGLSSSSRTLTCSKCAQHQGGQQTHWGCFTVGLQMQDFSCGRLSFAATLS